MQPLGNQGVAYTENYSTATAPWDERNNPASSAMEQEKQDAYLLSLVSPKISLNKHKLRTYLGCRNPSKDRLVTKEALVKAFDDNKLGVPRPQVERLFDMMDASGEGLIDYNYFIGAFDGGRVFDLRVPTKRSGSVSSPSLAETMDINDAEADATMRKPLTNLLQHRLFTKAEAAKAALRLHDFNGDGKLTLDELTEGCTQLVPGIEKRDVAAMMVKMDPRTDGCVDYRQFVNHVVEQTPLHPRAADGAQGRKLTSAGTPRKPTASLNESLFSQPTQIFLIKPPMLVPVSFPDCRWSTRLITPGQLMGPKGASSEVEQTPLHPRAADGAQGRKLLSAGAPLKSTASLLESASMPARGLWGDSPMRTAPARPTCLYPKSLSASFDASSWMQNPREEKLQTNNPAMYEVIASLSASSPDLAESLRGSCPEFTRPASEGASSKAHTGKRYWPSTRKDTSTVTIPAPGTTQASTSIDDHYMRKGGGSFMSFQTEDKERKAKAHSQAKTRIEAKTDFENSRACTDQQMAEKGDQDRLSIMSFGKQRYDQRAQMYEQARMLPQPFQADKQISPIFGRDSYYASTGYQGVHGQTGQFIHGLHSLLATN
eukprot:gene16982-23253_t